MGNINLTVNGMHCNSCKVLVTDVLTDLGAKNISISIDEKNKVGTVSFEHPDKHKAIKAIEDEGGYTVKQ